MLFVPHEFSKLASYNIILPCFRQQGIRESKETTIEGRFQFDLIQVFCP